MPLDVGLESSGLVQGRSPNFLTGSSKDSSLPVWLLSSNSLPRPQHTGPAFQLPWLAVFLELLYTILILVPGSPTPLTEVTSLNKSDLEPLFLRPWVCALICKPGSLSNGHLSVYILRMNIYIFISMQPSLQDSQIPESMAHSIQLAISSGWMKFTCHVPPTHMLKHNIVKYDSSGQAWQELTKVGPPE